MEIIEVVVRVRTSPDETFAFVAEPANGPRFDPTILAISTDPYPMRLGSRNTVQMRMLGFPVRAETRVVEFEPGRRMMIRSERPAWPVRAIASHVCEPDGTGTRYTYRIELTPARGMGWLVSRLAGAWRQSTVRAARNLEMLLGPADAGRPQAHGPASQGAS